MRSTKPIWKHVAVAAALLSPLFLTGCGDDEVSMEIVDQNQVISQNNGEKNARTFVNNRYPDGVARLLIDSDSTIGPDCRFGDGWTSGTIEMTDGTAVKIKCQTNGRGKGFSGCLTAADFKKKSYAEEEGHCSDTITSLKKFK